jgi:hypothetical protein
VHNNIFHYGCLEVCHEMKIVLVYDGAVDSKYYWEDRHGNSTECWKNAIVNVLSQCYSDKQSFELDYIVFDRNPRRTRNGAGGDVMSNVMGTQLVPHLEKRGNTSRWLVVTSNHWNVVLDLFSSYENMNFSSKFSELVPDWMKRRRIDVKQHDSHSCGVIACRILHLLSTMDLDKSDDDDYMCDEVKVNSIDSNIRLRSNYLCSYVDMLLEMKQKQLNNSN